MDFVIGHTSGPTTPRVAILKRAIPTPPEIQTENNLKVIKTKQNRTKQIKIELKDSYHSKKKICFNDL